jgi:hypothetical protein
VIGVTAPKYNQDIECAAAKAERLFAFEKDQHETGLRGWAERIRTSRRRFVERPISCRREAGDVKHLQENSTEISVGWPNAIWRFESSQPSQAVTSLLAKSRPEKVEACHHEPSLIGGGCSLRS